MAQELGEVVARAHTGADIVLGILRVRRRRTNIEDIHTRRDRVIEEIGFGEAELNLGANARQTALKRQILALAKQVAFADSRQPQRAVGCGVSDTQAQFARRLLFDVDFDDGPVGRGAGQVLDVDGAEEAQVLQPRARAPQFRGVEGIAFGQAEFAPDYLVERADIAFDIDALDKDLRPLVDIVGQIDDLLLRIAVEPRLNIDKSITQTAQRVVQRLNRAVDVTLVVPSALRRLDQAAQRLGVEVLQGGLDLDLAQFVALAFVDGEGDEKGILFRRQFGHCRDDLEIDIAFRQIEIAQLLAIDLQAIGIVGIVGGKESIEGAFLSHDLAAQVAVGEGLVADEADPPDFGLLALLDLENQIDPVLIEIDHLRFHRRAKPPAAPIEVENPGDVRLYAALSEHGARLQLDLLGQVLVFDMVVTFEGDLIDDRIFDHLHHQSVPLAPEGDIGE